MKRYGYPDAVEYLRLARATTAYICQQSELRSQNNEFCDAIDKLSGRLLNPNAAGLNFSAVMETLVDDKIHHVRVGGIVKFKDGILAFQSYWIELFGAIDTCDESLVLYRVHFDVAVPDNDKNNERHPLYHIQLGGKAANSEYINTEMKHWSSPRIPYVPLSLAMFLEIVFREFGTGYIEDRMRKDEQWTRIIKENEDVMIAGLLKVFENNKQMTISSVYYEGLRKEK